MVITNPAAFEQFKSGKTYDLVFTPRGWLGGDRARRFGQPDGEGPAARRDAQRPFSPGRAPPNLRGEEVSAGPALVRVIVRRVRNVPDLAARAAQLADERAGARRGRRAMARSEERRVGKECR